MISLSESGTSIYLRQKGIEQKEVIMVSVSVLSLITISFFSFFILKNKYPHSVSQLGSTPFPLTFGNVS